MKQQRRYIIKRTRVLPYFLFYSYLLFVLMSLFSVASYTWFAISRAPQVSNMNVYITSGTGLELAPDPGAEVWTSQLDIYATEELKDFKNSEKPTLRQTTWSDLNQSFYGPLYGYDGRLMPLEGFDYSQMKAVSWYKLEDQINANKLSPSSYYIKATFYARCDQPTDVTLAMPMEVDDTGTQGGGTYVVADPNTGRGPEIAVRMGMRMTYVDAQGNEVSERGPMYIYEPNFDRHVDGSVNYIPTYSVHEPDKELVDEGRMIKQRFTRSSDAPGEFVTNPSLFSLKSGEIVRIELYIWLEGQDVDCSNIMHNATVKEDEEIKIYANIQFTGTTENQSGMVPFE